MWNTVGRLARGWRRTREARHGEPRRMILQWHITDRCNLRCSHCYQEDYQGDQPTFAELLRVLEQYKALLRWRSGSSSGGPWRGHINVTGGEPFVRSDFGALLEVFASHRPYLSFAILTNGTLIDAGWAGRLRELQPTFVQVSLDGGATTHDAIRGAGSFERTLVAIEHLVQANVRCLISFTAHRGNFREFPEVVRIGRALGVARVWADRLIPLGPGGNKEDLVLTPEETREFFTVMDESGTAERLLPSEGEETEVSMRRALQFLVGGGPPYRCTAGDTLITIMPNGDLYPCRRMPVRVGNVRDTPLIELYENAGLLRALRDRERTPSACGKCAHASRCGGGLKCLAHAMTGDPHGPDPGCWLAEGAARRGTAGSRALDRTHRRRRGRPVRARRSRGGRR